MNKNQKIMFGLISSLGIFFFILLMLILSYIFAFQETTPPFIGFFVHYHIHFMVLQGVIGIIVGIIAVHGFAEQKKDTEATVEASKDLLMRFLDTNERKTICYLIENKHERTIQADISRIEGMDKVKAHRVLQKLQLKKLVKLESHGKIKIIKLEEDIKKIF